MNSPFSTKCPPEILVECFIYCVYPNTPDVDPDSAPILLTHICRRWREIALHTPPLWSRFRLDQLLRSALVPFGRHLQRSKGTQLTCLLRDSSQAAAGQYNPFLLRLLDEHDRWYDIALAGPFRQSNIHILAPEISFPKLHSLQILDWPNDASTSLRPIFKNSPNLRRLALKVPYICDCLKLMPSLSQLTTLKIWKTSSISLEWRQEETELQLYYVLSQCTSLESLSIGTFAYSQIVLEPGGFVEQHIERPLILSTLRFFSFPISDLDLPSIYLRAFTFPNLSELEISPACRLNLGFASHRADLMDFVRRHGAFGTVRKLTLGLPPSAELDFRLEIAEHFPSVVEIDLTEPEPYLTPWEGFHDGVVRFPFGRWSQDTSNDWADFVERRWAGSVGAIVGPMGEDESKAVERLKCLRMGVDAYACLQLVNEIALERIKRCVEEGFVLEPVHSRRWSLGRW